MTKQDLIEEIEGLIHLLESNTSTTAHVGISLQAMATIKDFQLSQDDADDKLHANPFYSYFQTAANDMHSQYPLRKNAVMEALVAYKRYINNSTKGSRAKSH